MKIVALFRAVLAHPLGCRTPIATLWRIVSWQVTSRFRSKQSMEWINGSRLIAKKSEAGATGNIYFGLHETEDMGFFAHLLRPGDLFVDAGANIGSYTVLAGTLKAKVHAFEPALETLPRLEENIAANSIEATVHGVALGEGQGEARFTRGRDSVNSLSALGEVVVPIVSLDSFELLPVAIKMDLEGGEENALKGAHRTLRSKNLLAVEVETVTQESAAILTEAGLMRRWYDPFTRTLHSVPHGRPNNELWIRDEVEVSTRVKGGADLWFKGKPLMARGS